MTEFFLLSHFFGYFLRFTLTCPLLGVLFPRFQGPRNLANLIALTLFGDGDVQFAVGEFLRRGDNTFQRSFQWEASEPHEAGEQQDLAE